MVPVRIVLVALVSLVCVLPGGAQTNSFLFGTMNCYWFFGKESYRDAEKPRTKAEYELKAGHLIGLLETEAPFFLSLQEIGNGDDVAALAQSAASRYRRAYQPIVAQPLFVASCAVGVAVL